MRFAIYFCPPPEDALARRAAAWLGRDAFADEMLPPVAAGPLSASEVAFHTAAARRYGFHATLKAPFRLAAGETEASLGAALDAFAARTEPPVIERLALKQIDGFFALVPGAATPALDALAGAVVEHFERFRAPMTEADIERRNPDALGPRELHNLHQWGYPYVFESFRFHMTLTGRVAGGEAERVRAAIEEYFAPMIGAPLEIGTLALFAEPDSGGPFGVRSIHRMTQLPHRKSA